MQCIYYNMLHRDTVKRTILAVKNKGFYTTYLMGLLGLQAKASNELTGETAHMPGRVASAPRRGVPDLGKVWQGTDGPLH